MKLIGVTQRVDAIKSYSEVREALDINWYKLLLKCGFIPIAVSCAVEPKEYFNNLPIDGIMLTGGNDLSSLNFTPENALRDEFEKKIIGIAIKKSIPVFGVCRGMQIICEYFGCELRKVTGHVAVRHSVNIAENSLLSEVIGSESIEVNSYHNYCVVSTQDNLSVVAKDLHDSVEAIQHKCLKIYGQMWHPERETSFVEYDLSIIKKMFD